MAANAIDVLIGFRATGVQRVIGAVRSIESRLAALSQQVAEVGRIELRLPSFGALGSAIQAMGSAVVVAQAGLQSLAGALSLVGRGFATVYGEGLTFRRTLESTSLSIQTLVANQLLASRAVTDVGEAFKLAGSIGARQMRELRLAALDTTVSFADLAASFQEGLGAGLAAGFSPDQIRQLTLLIGQLGSALGMPSYQLPQELRAILSGQIDRNARVGSAILPTDAERKQLQEFLRTDANKAFEFLLQRLQAVQAGGALAARTFSGLASAVQESLQLFATVGSGSLFDGLRAALATVQASILAVTRDAQTGMAISADLSRPWAALASVVDAVGRAIAAAVNDALTYTLSLINDIGSWLASNPATIADIGRIVREILESVIDIGRAFVEGLKFDDARQGAQAVADILQGVRGIAEAIAAVAGLIGTYIRGISLLIQGVREGLIAAVSAAQGLAQSLAAVLASVQAVVASVPLIGAGLSVATNAAMKLAGALGTVVGLLARQRVATGGTAPAKPAETAPDIGAAAQLAMRVPSGPKGGGGGGGRRGGQSPLQRLQAELQQARTIRETEATRQRALEEYDYREQRARLEGMTQELRQAYRDRRLAAETYYMELGRLSEEQYQAERQRLERQERDIEANLRALAADRERLEAVRAPQQEKQQQLTQLAREEAQLFERLRGVAADMVELDQRRETARRQMAIEARDEFAREQERYQRLQAQLAELTAATPAARTRIDIEADYQRALREIDLELPTIGVTVEGEDAAARLQAIMARLTETQRAELAVVTQIRDARLAQLGAEEAIAEAQRAINELRREQGQLAERLRDEGKTEAEVQAAVTDLYRERKAILEAVVERARQAAAAAPTQANADAVRDLDDALLEIGRTGQDVGARLRQDFASSLEDLFASLITNARNAGEAFKRFALSVVASIARIIAQMLVLRLLQGALGGIFGPSIGGKIGDILGGRRQAGGPVQPGKAYIVGEAGPELFMPGTTGQIIPSAAITQAPMASMTPMTQPVTIVNRIDSGVFDDHLAGPAGERLVLNHIRANRSRLKEMFRAL